MHHTSCPYAHLQNGLAERKHKHIVEKSMAMMAYSYLPMKFWNEACFTSVYFINKLLGTTLSDQSPLETLFNVKLYYHHLMMFRCLCYSSL